MQRTKTMSHDSKQMCGGKQLYLCFSLEFTYRIPKAATITPTR